VDARQVEMPSLSEAELRSSLRYEARQHLPLENLGEAALDCQVIGATAIATVENCRARPDRARGLAGCAG